MSSIVPRSEIVVHEIDVAKSIANYNPPNFSARVLKSMPHKKEGPPPLPILTCDCYINPNLMKQYIVGCAARRKYYERLKSEEDANAKISEPTTE